jgi:hypothetical protein
LHNVFYSRRHVMVHNAGLVDAQYIHKSGDGSYTVGQRLVIREMEVIKLIRIIEKLGRGLKGL